jgi:pyridoxine/pyridoxamine 5'-phosphate oxidase
MCCHFFANRNWFDHSESNVAALTEELAVVVAVVIDESGRPQEKMVFLELLRVNNAKVSADSSM